MKSVVTIFSVVLIALTLFAQDTWKLERDKNGIKVFTRKTPKVSMKESKTEIFFNSPPEQLIKFFKDVENHKSWMHRISTSDLLKKTNDNEFYAYYIASAPWPVSNRDAIVHYKIKKEANGDFVVIATGMPEEIPQQKGLVRIPKLYSTWEFLKQPNGTTKLIYTSLSEPGGGIPEWLANSGATDTPFNTVAALKAKVEK